jgi:hypothetical protein
VWGGRCPRLYSRSEKVCGSESEEGEEVAAKGAVLGIAIVLPGGQSSVLTREDGSWIVEQGSPSSHHFSSKEPTI